MTHNHDSQDDLQPVVDALRANRPELSALELDAAKQRVYARVARQPGRRARSADLMKSRIAILATLVVGMLFSTAGASLAISGFASSNDKASVAQYGPEDTGGGGVLGEDEGGGPTTQENNPGGTGEENNGGGVQPARQVEAGSQGSEEQLPFTGFAAIPILLGGVALLTTGLVLRRRSRDDAA
ncbi:MAG TPA: hypothetical protein VFN44_20695 [Solirubrobacteraceae bacterium]|nr:hypothetical protein [Solirubrobacteraceae bacterium]